IIGCNRQNQDDRLIIPLGDLTVGEHREITVELQIPEGTGTRHVASGKLLFDKVPKMPMPLTTGFSVDIRYTDDIVELQKGKDWDTQAKVDLAVSTKGVERAMQSLDEGNRAKAEQQLTQSASALMSSPAISNSPLGAALIQG